MLHFAVANRIGEPGVQLAQLEGGFESVDRVEWFSATQGALAPLGGAPALDASA